MKKIFCSLFLIIIASLTGCLNMSNYRPPLYIELAMNIQNIMEKKLSSKHGMNVVGTTEGVPDTVNTLGLSFQAEGPITKDRLRYLLVDCVQEYLHLVNSDEKIRPFLKNYPFTPSNIEISIFVIGPTRETYNIYYPNIGVAGAYNNKVVFNTKDPDDIYIYKTEEFETYEEALRIVKEQYPDVIAD